MGDAPPSRQDTELSIGDLGDKSVLLFTPERTTITAIMVHSRLQFRNDLDTLYVEGHLRHLCTTVREYSASRCMW